MRILFLSAWCPLPADNGVRLRVAHLLRGLAQFHQMDLLSFAPDPLSAADLHELRSFCTNVELVPETPFAARPVHPLRQLVSPQPRSVLANHSPAMANAVRQRAAKGYDLVIASTLHMAPYALLLPGVPRLLEEIELGIIRDQVRTQQPLPTRLRHSLTWLKTARYLASLLRGFAGASAVSETELTYVRRLAPAQTHLAVVPNGVDALGCAAFVATPQPDTLIYPGALAYHANADAVGYFVADILPHIRAEQPGVCLKVTGRATAEQMAALQTDGVEFTGYLDDVRPAVAAAWAEVVPLRVGGGTRLKVLEAMALGTPVITTSKGIEGLDVQPEQDVLLADTPDQFTTQTIRLLRSPALRHELASRGRSVAARYDWGQSVARLNELVMACVAAPDMAARHPLTSW